MKNVPSVIDTKVLFAEWFERMSKFAFSCVYVIALHDFLYSCNVSYSKRVNDYRMERKPPYLWKWMDGSGLPNGGMRVVLHDSDIKRFLFEFSRYDRF